MSFSAFPTYSTPATLITPPGPVGVSMPYETLGANGATGATGSNQPHSDTDSDGELPDIPLTFDAEHRLLMQMNDQQGKTIEEQMLRIKALEAQLVEKPVQPICYITCDHCKGTEPKAEPKA